MIAIQEGFASRNESPAGINIRLVPGRQLSEDDVRCWGRLQRANPEMDSPFFHPEFTRDAAETRDGVEVAILEAASEPIGYFPFERGRSNVGVPVGGHLSDFQGMIARPEFDWDASRLIAECRLSGWRFDSLIASQRPWTFSHWLTADSPRMDLSGGFDAYCTSRRESGSQTVSRTLTKAKKVAKQLGPIRFEPHSADPNVFRSLLDWKSRQYRRIKSPNYLAQPSTMALVERLLARQDGDFSGVLSAMYFGDRLAAVHFGLLSRGVLHIWFPTYNEDFAVHSPGLIFFVELAKAARDMGIHRIDLGRGNERFKASLRSDGVAVAEGAVGLGWANRSLGRMTVAAREWLRKSPFHDRARAVVRGVRGLFVSGS